MASIEDLADRVERLLLRHEELQRTHALTASQLAAVSAERDSLKSRLAAARQRVDALLDRLPPVAGAADREVAGQDRNTLTEARDEQA